MYYHNQIHFYTIYRKDQHLLMENDVGVLLICVQLHNQVEVSKKMYIERTKCFKCGFFKRSFYFIY